MGYHARITTKQPACFIIMVDQSGSMSEPVVIYGKPATKAEAVASVINNILSELLARSRGDGTLRHYFDIAVVGYSGDSVESLLPQTDTQFVSPAQLASTVRTTRQIQQERIMPDGRKIITSTTQKIWIEPKAEWRTPMCQAIGRVHSLAAGWCALHQDSFPPLVINITDGEATDAEPEQLEQAAAKLCQLSTRDGNLLMINVHIDRSEGEGEGVIFPWDESQLPEDRNAHILYAMSSIMPEIYQQEIKELLDIEESHPFRGMAYKASITDLIRIMNIGSTTANL